jgi:hypothetical protein
MRGTGIFATKERAQELAAGPVWGGSEAIHGPYWVALPLVAKDRDQVRLRT